jgi:DNA-binding CsgD family transcriptional regulator/PAS domain-containing protein
MDGRGKKYRHLVEQLYEGVLTDNGWRQALRAIAAATDSGSASIVVFDPQTKAATVNEHFSGTPEMLAAYNTHYYRHDEAIPIAPLLPLGHWYHDERHIGAQHMRRSVFYQDFFRRYDISTTICNRLLESDGTQAYLSLQRRYGQPGYTDADLRVYNHAFIPHVERAVRIRIELQRATDSAALASLVLDRLRAPVLVLDEQARILKTNTEADALMRRTSQLTVRHGRFSPQGLKPGQFEQLLQAACGRHGPAVAGGAWIETPHAQEADQGHQNAALQCLVLPLPVSGTSTLNPWARPLALVLLRQFDPQHRLQPQPQLMRQLFDLTPAETKVALALCQGETPAEIAHRLGVGIRTVRTHLGAAFAKTNTTRQCDLVRLLSMLSIVDSTA